MNHARRLVRAWLISSNCTGRPVFCCTTIERVRISGPATIVPILIFTRSHPRNWISIDRSKSARSRRRCSRSRKNRMTHICRGFRGRLVPTFLPPHSVRGDRRQLGDSVNVPFRFSFGHDWPAEKRAGAGKAGAASRLTLPAIRESMQTLRGRLRTGRFRSALAKS